MNGILRLLRPWEYILMYPLPVIVSAYVGDAFLEHDFGEMRFKELYKSNAAKFKVYRLPNGNITFGRVIFMYQLALPNKLRDLQGRETHLGLLAAHIIRGNAR